MQKARLGVWMWQGLHGKFLQVPLQWCKQVWRLGVSLCGCGSDYMKRIWLLQMMVVLVDKLLRTEVVQCQAVANWVFSDQMQKDFTRLVCPAVAPATWKQLPVSVRQFFQILLQDLSLFRHVFLFVCFFNPISLNYIARERELHQSFLVSFKFPCCAFRSSS